MKILHKDTNRPDFEPASKQARVYDFLKQQSAGVLATVDPNNNPYAAVIYYTIDTAFVVRFLTKKWTKKSDNLAHNNHAMLVVYDVPSQTTVQISGVVTKVADTNETSEAFRHALGASLDTAANALPPVTKLDAGEYVAYEMRPVEVKMAVYSSRSAENRGKLFETIDLPILKFGAE